MIHHVKVEMKSILGINMDIGIHLGPVHVDVGFISTEVSLVWITGRKMGGTVP